MGCYNTALSAKLVKRNTNELVAIFKGALLFSVYGTSSLNVGEIVGARLHIFTPKLVRASMTHVHAHTMKKQLYLW